MITITYKPSASPDAQIFLCDLASALDPLDEIRKKEIEKAVKANLPGMGGAIEEIIRNPVTWIIVDKAVDAVVALLVGVYLKSLNNNASKKLEFTINKCEKVIINLNNYTNSFDLKTDLTKKLQEENQ